MCVLELGSLDDIFGNLQGVLFAREPAGLEVSVMAATRIM